MGIAQTGTGKTAAYLLPLPMKVKIRSGMSPRALILVPTRELAMQVNEHIRQLPHIQIWRFLAVYGGVGIKPQIEAIEKVLIFLLTRQIDGFVFAGNSLKTSAHL